MTQSISRPLQYAYIAAFGGRLLLKGSPDGR